MGVLTKHKKPAKANTYGITWFAEPNEPKNILSIEGDSSNSNLLWNDCLQNGKFIIPIHDETCNDIARLLIKIGIEIIVTAKQMGHFDTDKDFLEAREFVLGINPNVWPYLVLRSNDFDKNLTNIFAVFPDKHEYIRECGFDIYLHLIGNEIVLFFSYGYFHAGIAITNRSLEWQEALIAWEVPYVGCPIEFQNVVWPK
jgi:hypothetical protein